MRKQPKFRPNLIERCGIWWCRLMHDSPMWPVRGHYHCRTCGRCFVISWVSESVAEPVRIRMRPETRVARPAV